MANKKQKGSKVYRSGNWGVVDMSNCAYSFEIAGEYKLATSSVMLPGTLSGYELQPYNVGNFKIVPNGIGNILPLELMDILEDNNLTEGVFKRQRGLLWGQGPALFMEEFVEGEKKRTWVTDPEIEAWLKTWDYEEMLRRAIVDYYHMEGHYAKLTLARGSRIGRAASIATVEHVGYQKCRIEWPDDAETIKRFIVGDWLNPNLLGLKAYPAFDAKNPGAYPVTMMYCNMYSFGHTFYGIPAWYGALNWIKRGSAIPKILEALSKNSLQIKWHIKSPASYWQKQRETLIRECGNKEIKYEEQMLEDLKDKVFLNLGNVLSGEVNVGKFFTSETVTDALGNTDEWKIEAIDQKIKEYVDSQLAIAKQADNAITSGMGLHPSLSNIIVDGKLASGSELLYSLKLYLATETDIPESIVCRAINAAIAINFPGKNLKMGFYHQVVKAEDSVTSQNRTKNAI